MLTHPGIKTAQEQHRKLNEKNLVARLCRLVKNTGLLLAIKENRSAERHLDQYRMEGLRGLSRF